MTAIIAAIATYAHALAAEDAEVHDPATERDIAQSRARLAEVIADVEAGAEEGAEHLHTARTLLDPPAAPVDPVAARRRERERELREDIEIGNNAGLCDRQPRAGEVYFWASDAYAAGVARRHPGWHVHRHDVAGLGRTPLPVYRALLLDSAVVA